MFCHVFIDTPRDAAIFLPPHYFADFAFHSALLCHYAYEPLFRRLDFRLRLPLLPILFSPFSPIFAVRRHAAIIMPCRYADAHAAIFAAPRRYRSAARDARPALRHAPLPRSCRACAMLRLLMRYAPRYVAAPALRDRRYAALRLLMPAMKVMRVERISDAAQRGGRVTPRRDARVYALARRHCARAMLCYARLFLRYCYRLAA